MARQRRLRIVVAGQLPPPIGGQNIIVQRILYLLQAEDEHAVDHLAFRFTSKWSQIRQAGLNKVIELLSVWRRLAKLRLHGPIDVLLFPVGGPHIFPVLRDIFLLPIMCLASRAVVLHFQAAGISQTLAGMPFMLRKLVQYIYGKAFGAVVLSEYGRTDPVALGVERIAVIPNGLADEYRADLTVGRNETDEVRILNVGHLCSDKGTPQLLAAFSQISKVCPKCVLYLVGDCLPPYSPEELKRNIERLDLKGRVVVTGVLEGDALSQQYARAHLFVFPSIAPYESFGLVMVEAMMWALPMVVTDWRANLEVAGKNVGVIGYSTEPDMERNLANALGAALKNKDHWTDWGQRNRERYLKYYSIESFSARWRDYLDLNFPE